MNKKDYYEEIIVEIKDLIDTNPELAFSKLDKELNMPYIPEKYEQEFSNLIEELRSNILQNSKVNNELSKDEVIEILSSNNIIKIPMALFKLADLNLKGMIDELKMIFSNKKISRITKTVIYEHCVDQKVDVEFYLNNHTINPIKIGSIIKLPIFVKSVEYLENNINQNPSLKEVAFKYLELYSLKNFPEMINEKKELGPIIVEIAHTSIGLPYISSNDSDEVNKVKKILENNL